MTRLRNHFKKRNTPPLKIEKAKLNKRTSMCCHVSICPVRTNQNLASPKAHPNNSVFSRDRDVSSQTQMFMTPCDIQDLLCHLPETDGKLYLHIAVAHPRETFPLSRSESCHATVGCSTPLSPTTSFPFVT